MFNTHKPLENDLPTSSQLLRSTIIALFVAGALLVCIVIPAEYGTDPTGVGELLGLKKMGEIKANLEKESQNENQKNRVINLGEQKKRILNEYLLSTYNFLKKVYLSFLFLLIFNILLYKRVEI